MEDERRALAARMTDKAAKLLLDMPLRLHIHPLAHATHLHLRVGQSLAQRLAPRGQRTH